MVDGLSTGNDGGGDDGQEHPGKLSCDFESDGDDGLGVSDVGKGPFPTTRANINPSSTTTPKHLTVASVLG